MTTFPEVPEGEKETTVFIPQMVNIRLIHCSEALHSLYSLETLPTRL